MKSPEYNIAFFGSSLVSAYWNGAATYYRGMIKALHKLGHHTTFFEPDAFGRQQHRDMPDPVWAESVIYQPVEAEVKKALMKAKEFDIVVKASGVGVFDSLLEQEVLQNRKSHQKIVFWDVDAPATLASMARNPDNTLKALVPEYDLILTYGGGQPVIDAYQSLGAERCVPVNNALDPETHFSVDRRSSFTSDLSFLGNRLPDREERVERFFFSVAERLPEKQFVLGGSGWESRKFARNIHNMGHVYTRDHNAFNSSPKAILNISRESMAKMGFSPATRVFEAAGAGACIISDAWEGIELFLKPDEEILVARDGDDVVRILKDLSSEQAASIGQAALSRVLSEHTYQNRAKEVIEAFRQSYSGMTTTNQEYFQS